jgi:ABC-type transport system involved in cytochrome bd biosynthesis fused ATPase/permease subunit
VAAGGDTAATMGGALMTISELLKHVLDDPGRSARLEHLILAVSVPLAVATLPLAVLAIGLIIESRNYREVGVGILAAILALTTATGRAAYSRRRAAKKAKKQIEQELDTGPEEEQADTP